MITQSPETTAVTDADIKRTEEMPGQASKQQTQGFSQQAQGFMDQLSQRFGPLGERAKQLQQEYGQKASEQVRARPMAALGVAVAVGVVLSKILGRR
jgi:ElaB/YqjD/DUF883 family membrane-anchored ribosome-binding protein